MAPRRRVRLTPEQAQEEQRLIDDAFFEAITREAAPPITATEIAARYQPTRQDALAYEDQRRQQRAEYERLRAELLAQPPTRLSEGQNPAAKAETLLRERLGPARWRLFQETRVLMVPSRRWPGLDYRLRVSHPVEVIERGALRASLCVVPKRGEPEADRLLTILDLIETDERKLWEMAQVTYRGQLGQAPMPAPPQAAPNSSRSCQCCGGRTGSEMRSDLWGTSLCTPCRDNWSGGGGFFCFLKWLIGRPSIRCHPAAPHCGFNPLGLVITLALAVLIVMAKLGFF